MNEWKWQWLWQELATESWIRISAIREPSRLLYFLFVVIGVGGLGAWRQLGDFGLLRENLATYAMGISAAAAVELVLPDTTGKSMRMLGLSLGILAVGASLVSLQSKWVDVVWLAPLCAWLLWMLSSSANANIGGATPTTATTGGDTDHLAGNLDEFVTE